TASIVDVTTNTLGAFAGALVVALFLAALHRARGARSYFGVPTFVLTGAYTLAVLCEALTPLFRSAPLPGLNGGPLDRLRGALGLALPLRLGAVPWSDVLLFAPAGLLVVMLLTARGRSARRTWQPVAPAGAACAFGAAPGAVGARRAGDLAGLGQRGGAPPDRRSLRGRDERAEFLRRAGDGWAGAAALRMRSAWGGAGAAASPLTGVLTCSGPNPDTI